MSMGIRESEEMIISTENVKPSSPTPQNLKTYQISMLDQIVPSMLVPFILYFPNPSLQTINPHSLKLSLSSILSRFYPFAGRVTDDGRAIDCNDEGVPFVVAKFKGCSLSDLTDSLDRNNLPSRFMPCQVSWDSGVGPDSTVALVKLSFFDCGGAVLAAVFWHKLVDAVAAGTFLKSWAAAARGSAEAVCPNYISQSLFPHKPELPSDYVSLAGIMRNGRPAMRRFAFDAAAVASLKARCGGVERPSRVEAVSGLIWRCFMAASLANSAAEFSILTHAVNSRRRARPAFPPECFGNWPGLAAAASRNEVEPDLGELVRSMRDSIRKIDDDFVTRLRGDGGVAGVEENLRRTWSDAPGGADLLSISSWCGFGLYDLDFGWGKPGWITRCDKGSESDENFLNVVWLMDSKNGDGVEAWVILEDKYMAVFERVEELKALALLDPSPLSLI